MAFQPIQHQKPGRPSLHNFLHRALQIGRGPAWAQGWSETWTHSLRQYTLEKHLHDAKEVLQAETYSGSYHSGYSHVISVREWVLLSKIVEVLDIFYQSTQLLSQSKTSISAKFPILSVLLKSLEVSSKDSGVMGMNWGLAIEVKRKFAQDEYGVPFPTF